jgi:hypothetical protein
MACAVDENCARVGIEKPRVRNASDQRCPRKSVDALRTPGLLSLPRNVTDTTRVVLRLDGTVHDCAVSPKLASLRTEDALAIRQFFAPARRGKRSGFH